MRTKKILGVLLALAALAAPAWTLELTSSSFKAGGSLPVEFTCDGTRQSPPLAWSGAPAGTKFFAITMHHVPGPGDRHVYWVEYGIPATQSSVTAGTHAGGTWGINTVDGQATYTPPCSHGPGVKEYTFTLYALSAAPVLSDAKVTMEALLKAMEGKTLATATLAVTYERSSTTEDSASEPKAKDAPAAGERPPIDLLHIPVGFLSTELTLTEAQVTQIETALKDLRGKEAEEAITKVFTDAQKARLPALLTFLEKLPDWGIPPEAIGDLKLTADQRTKLGAATTREAVGALLTADQKKILDAARAKGPGPR